MFLPLSALPPADPAATTIISALSTLSVIGAPVGVTEDVRPHHRLALATLAPAAHMHLAFALGLWLWVPSSQPSPHRVVRWCDNCGL
jgi:hypothetical protein